MMTVNFKLCSSDTCKRCYVLRPFKGLQVAGLTYTYLARVAMDLKCVEQMTVLQ
jgi:hypothetical protein